LQNKTEKPKAVKVEAIFKILKKMTAYKKCKNCGKEFHKTNNASWNLKGYCSDSCRKAKEEKKKK